VDLRQLRSFVAVADELHFGRAATRLAITTPSLSQQIKTLERSLGVVLFLRDSRGVRLTTSGAALLPRALSTIAEADGLRDEALRLARSQAEPLRVGFLLFALCEATRTLLSEFGRQHPEVDLQLRQYEWVDPSAGLLPRTVDMALVRPPFAGAERMLWVELDREPLYAIMATDHPLTRDPAPLTAARLVQEPFIELDMADRVFAATWYLHEHRDTSSPAPFITTAATSEEWLAQVALGRGVDVVPKAVVERESGHTGVTFRHIEDLPPAPVVLAWDPTRVTKNVRLLAQFAAGRTRRVARGQAVGTQ
jgi:DNA-binding transcriptional LysR family regulator